MVPRTEVDFLPGDMPAHRAVRELSKAPHSRYPVMGESADDIIGFVHVRDLFEAIAEGRDAALSDIVRSIPYFPSTARVLPTLTKMRADGHQIAVVVDEYGGTDGIVTLEDLVEEVVGEIFDEYDTATAPDADRELIEGRLNLQDFSEATGIVLPRGASDTVGGFVTERLGRLAVVGDIVEVDGATIEVTALDRRRIAEVRVTAREGSPATQ
jgi:putative hemolysin